MGLQFVSKQPVQRKRYTSPKRTGMGHVRPIKTQHAEVGKILHESRLQAMRGTTDLAVSDQRAADHVTDTVMQMPNKAAPSAAMILAAFQPHENKPKCAACQSAGEESEFCPECAQVAEIIAPEPDKDDPAECESCALTETIQEIFVDRASAPRENGWTTATNSEIRPLEAGWWTSRTTTSNTIGCDGSGSMSVMQNGSTYLHGVTDCTIEHEQTHANDWLSRYGNDICKDRAKGDLPHFDPPGKDAYATFLKKSECSAWTVGEACRRRKLAACKTDACKTYVQGHVDFAVKMVKKYC